MALKIFSSALLGESKIALGRGTVYWGVSLWESPPLPSPLAHLWYSACCTNVLYDTASVPICQSGRSRPLRKEVHSFPPKAFLNRLLIQDILAGANGPNKEMGASGYIRRGKSLFTLSVVFSVVTCSILQIPKLQTLWPNESLQVHADQ